MSRAGVELHPEVTKTNVAEVAGFSRRTVNRALQNANDIAPFTLQAVFDASVETGYLLTQRILRGSKAIGVTIPDSREPHYSYYRAMAETIADICRQKDFKPQIHQLRSNHAVTTALEQLDTFPVEGVILLGTQPFLPDLIPYATPFRPMILVDSGPQVNALLGTVRVDVDYQDGMTQVLEHLLGKGHQRIAYVSASMSGSNYTKRGTYETFFKESTTEDQLFFPDRVEGNPNSPHTGYYAAKRLFELTTLPTAIITETDNMALGVIRAAFDRGLKVPRDLAVVAFGRSTLTDFTYPRISTSYPFVSVPHTVVDIIDQLLREDPKGKLGTTVKIPMQVHFTESTELPKRAKSLAKT